MKSIFSSMIKSAMRPLVAVASIVAITMTTTAKEKLIILNEGNWQSDNGRLTYFEDNKVVSNNWFRDCNGYKLGDTPNDIIQVKQNLIAMTINWSNIIQFIDESGKAVAETEDVPNNRKMASDGRYVYVTSYAHEVLINGRYKTFTKGFVAKIDTENFKVVDAVEVGYEPEGIAYYQGKLFVANSGGYAFQENHDYETTVTVLDVSTMKKVRTVDTKQINLYGKMSQSGQYLCINSPGDYYDISAATIIMDCEAVIAGKADTQCFVKLNYAATYSCPDMNGNFYAIGSKYSYYTGEHEFNYVTIDPAAVMQSKGSRGVSSALPGTMISDIKKMTMPYGIYVNPYTGYIYATDAAGFVEGGTLYQWSPTGSFIKKYSLYINPGHFLALNPNPQGAVEDIYTDTESEDGLYFNFQGMPVEKPQKGELYIHNGKKILWR